jgi:hypothetical protein
MSCKECGSKYVVNVKHCLCVDCNHKRLHGKSRFESAVDRKRELSTKTSNKRRRVKTDEERISLQKRKDKRSDVIRMDRETYRRVFDSKPHECEECGHHLPEVFEDEAGKIMFVSQYSHILGKKANPEHRHNHINFNRLCLEHHQQWEFGDRKSMKIYGQNLITIQKLYGTTSR